VSLRPGTRLGPYEITAPIGMGGMGEVYKARDTRLDRTVAIKILPETLAADPLFRERFAREARAVAAVSHPHICALYDVGDQEGIAFLVMELIEGETLAARLERSALAPADALKIAVEIASALDKAHRAGIVHRDLKPGNIMLTRAGAKLLDFGLAKPDASVLGGTNRSMLPTTPVLTQQGSILGTFQYMAPEQLEGRDADVRSDIFAFGAVFYEMLTGRKAFDSASQARLVSAILKDHPPLASSLQPSTSPLVDRIVARCLAKDADERFQSAHDLLMALQWAGELVDSRHGSVPDPTARIPHRSRWWKLATAAAVAAALLLMWPAALYLRRPEPEPLVTRLDVVTPDTADPFSFALSPDGRQLAFVGTTDSEPRLWVRPLDQTMGRALPGTEGASQPFWSPDGSAIGFFADGRLKRLNLVGGGLQVLADAPVPRGGTWSRDGVIVFSPTVNTTLLRVSAGGGTPMPVTMLGPGQGTHRWPHFLPNGRQFLFLATLGQPDTRGIYLGSLDGGEPRRVLNADSSAAYQAGKLLVVSQGALVAHDFDPVRGSVSGTPVTLAQPVGVDAGGATGLSAFSVSATGVLAHRNGATARRQLIWVDRAGKALGAVAPVDDFAPATPDVAPNGQRVAVFRNVQGNPDVWLVEVGRAILTRFTFGPTNEVTPLWSRDGRRIVFSSNRNGHWDLFERAADGVTDEQPLLVNAQEKSPLDWSPDGRLVLYGVQDSKTRADLWALPLTGDRTPFPVVQTAFDDLTGRFSPDGRWLAYVSNETGRYEVYVRPFPGPGEKQQVSIGGGIFPIWSHDGRELFYLGLDSRMVAVPVPAGSDARSLQPGAAVTLFQNPRLAVAGNNGIGSFLSRAPYAVMADGRFLLDVTADASLPITVVLNWPAALKK
jgi:serine/threonine protein kinase/Tol biopolymer transport system component